ncbi:hypothetical protein TNCV_1071991 [Trichonephila clavipes]|nr:hypothetical protein TNCV_1071991 [Trichonephila clavipes]
MLLKARSTTGVHLTPCVAEFREPQSDTVDQVALATTYVSGLQYLVSEQKVLSINLPSLGPYKGAAVVVELSVHRKCNQAVTHDDATNKPSHTMTQPTSRHTLWRNQQAVTHDDATNKASQTMTQPSSHRTQIAATTHSLALTMVSLARLFSDLLAGD